MYAYKIRTAPLKRKMETVYVTKKENKVAGGSGGRSVGQTTVFVSQWEKRKPENKRKREDRE